MSDWPSKIGFRRAGPGQPWVDHRLYESMMPPSKKERKQRRQKNRTGPKGPAQVPSLRDQVYERDGHRCVECGTGENLTLDHIRPRSRGGKNTLDNLQTMCSPCNNAKGSRWDDEPRIVWRCTHCGCVFDEPEDDHAARAEVAKRLASLWRVRSADVTGEQIDASGCHRCGRVDGIVEVPQ